jgi:hypothetical protein
MDKATDSSDLTFRQDYFAGDKAWAALVSLLSDTFGIDLALQLQFSLEMSSSSGRLMGAPPA